MCCEDLQIGRASGGSMLTRVIGTSAIPILGASPIRTRIALQNVASAGILWFSNRPNMTTFQGFRLDPTAAPIILTVEEFGSLVRGPWYAIGSVSAELTVVETVTEMCNGEGM